MFRVVFEARSAAAAVQSRQRKKGYSAGLTTMSLDLDLIFPIHDLPSANLMMLKANCLWSAGIIGDRQREVVQNRAERFLRRDTAVSALCGMPFTSSLHQRYGREAEGLNSPAAPLLLQRPSL
jgi:hypothetical protein